MSGDGGTLAQDAAVAALCAKYGGDGRHGRHVAGLARRLFEAFSPLHGLGQDAERLLEHASQLHDIGYFIAAKGHHRHSAYIALNDAQLADYPADAREILAAVVRNHRKRARPGPKSWPKERRQAVLWLSALLRVADSLDYDHTQAADIAEVRQSGQGFEILVRGVDPRPAAVRLAGKADLLEGLVGGPVRFAEARR